MILLHAQISRDEVSLCTATASGVRYQSVDREFDRKLI